ncbi:PmoA family protein [uncultured Paludibaculum sp.]|uniref:DUF6807 domain-containing protein n=1 Tax=uncultured Paludibaculum sp. TaxID=1765020 RepID=UPI002AAC170D|nr:PmoA family protein [uncultured Paludibaculum sp.]
MKHPLLLLALALPLCAQVKFSQTPGKLEITIDGKPFSTFYAGGDAPKPYLAPLRTADGLIVTRRYPMESVAGETKDHPHHRGLWFTHGDINGIDFWANEPGAKGRHGTIKLDKIESVKGGKSQGSVRATFTWIGDTGTPLLREDRTMIFHGGPTTRMIDFDVTFTALEKATFGDTKEGFFAIRLRDELSEKRGNGKMTSSDGKTGMAEIWGKQFPWVDDSGTVEGKKVGVAIFDAPSNFRHPTYWHARDYGLFATNAFGLHDFYNDKMKNGSHTLEKGQTLRFRYRVVIHQGDTAEANLGALYSSWTKSLGR